MFGISKVWSTPEKEAIFDKKLAVKEDFSYNGHLYNHYGWENTSFIGSRQNIVKQIVYVKYYCTCGDIGTFIWYQIWKYTMHDISTQFIYSFPKFSMSTFFSYRVMSADPKKYSFVKIWWGWVWCLSDPRPTTMVTILNAALIETWYDPRVAQHHTVS